MCRATCFLNLHHIIMNKCVSNVCAHTYTHNECVGVNKKWNTSSFRCILLFAIIFQACIFSIIFPWTQKWSIQRYIMRNMAKIFTGMEIDEYYKKYFSVFKCIFYKKIFFLPFSPYCHSLFFMTKDENARQIKRKKRKKVWCKVWLFLHNISFSYALIYIFLILLRICDVVYNLLCKMKKKK